jgi:hypothetical protein
VERSTVQAANITNAAAITNSSVDLCGQAKQTLTI